MKKLNACTRLGLMAVVGLQPWLAAAQQAELEEVVVTAERRASDLQARQNEPKSAGRGRVAITPSSPAADVVSKYEAPTE